MMGGSTTADIMSVFSPQCGADSLGCDRLGCFNLSIRGHGSDMTSSIYAHSFMQSDSKRSVCVSVSDPQMLLNSRCCDSYVRNLSGGGGLMDLTLSIKVAFSSD